MEIPALALPGLFARLAQGQAARITVVTPNLRLAQDLQAQYDRGQLEAGRAAWEAPDILPLAAYLARCHEEAVYGSRGDALPALLDAAQAQVLWEDALRASSWRERVLSIGATAALAGEAWVLAHQWRIEGALGRWPGSEDAEAFAAWCEHYRRRTQRDGFIDTARLPALVAALLADGGVAAPGTLVLYGFDLVTPQHRDFLDACARAGIELLRSSRAPVAGTVRRALFDSPRRELECAARWARTRLEQARGAAAPRIAIVVPDLAQRRAEVARVFARVLSAGASSSAPSFNVSLGEPLSDRPLADAALALLELALSPTAFERVSRVLRSPFIAGAEAEQGARARLDAVLRRIAPAELTLRRLRSLLTEAAQRRGAVSCPDLAGMLERMAECSRHAGRAGPHEWARRFSALLDAAGFPGERALDSAEFQVLAKWREALAALAELGSVSPAWSAADALARMRRVCADTLFQPATGAAPVHVLGVLESAGLAFDHLWVSGLTEEAWPLAARPHPLIAPALQRHAGLPQATPEASLAVDRALTDAWRDAAAEVVFSSARADGDRELLPSPLIASLAATDAAQLGIGEFETLRGALFAAGRRPGAVTAWPDGVAPPLGAAAARGGTAILADQAACPFRAFAHFRLDARALERPEPGLGPAERGQLLHAMMARLWRELRSQAALRSAAPARLGALIADAAAHAVAQVRAGHPGRLEGRFAELERERLAGIAREWLVIEAQRAPFEVVLREEKMTLHAGDLALEGRVDRIDRLEDGGCAVIDYKSGQASVSAWFGDRPDDVQLPLYALAAHGGEVRAVAFARLKTGQAAFLGLARDDGLLPGVGRVEEHRTARRHAGSWAQLQAIWRDQVRRLGEDFASGDARVDPKRLLSTCLRCDLKPLCRVHERLGALAEGDEGTGEDEE